MAHEINANKTINTSKNHRRPQFLPSSPLHQATLIPSSPLHQSLKSWTDRRGNKQAAHMTLPMCCVGRNRTRTTGRRRTCRRRRRWYTEHRWTRESVRHGWRRSDGGAHGETAAPNPTTGSASKKCKNGFVPATTSDFTMEI
jgi:hypothetical protein